MMSSKLVGFTAAHAFVTTVSSSGTPTVQVRNVTQAADMLKAAEADAKRLEVESMAKLEESLARRQALAERSIAQAEAQATAEVKAAAVDMAAKAAETILAARLASAKADPAADAAIAQIGRLN